MHTNLFQMCSKARLSLAVVAVSTVGVGCAITDYRGWPEHKTAAEAKLWGDEIAFLGFSPALDGTYSYTVQYNCRGMGISCPVTITSYRNPVFASFSRDGIVDRDGDNIQGKYGSLTTAPATLSGKFSTAFVAYDDADGCQFYGIPGSPPLKQNFLSVGDLFGQIWSGALGRSFTLNVNAIELNGVRVDLTNTLSIAAAQNGERPINYAIDMSSPGGKDLIRAILNNTASGQPVTVAVRGEGPGLSPFSRAPHLRGAGLPGARGGAPARSEALPRLAPGARLLPPGRQAAGHGRPGD